MYRNFPRVCTCALVFVLLAFIGSAGASEIALTSVGQSPDAVMVNVVLKRQKIVADYDNGAGHISLRAHK